MKTKLPPGTVTWAEIDLHSIAENVRALKKHVGERVEVIAVVKANAYGHGAVPVAKAALKAGAARLAVHRLNEAVELREAGIEAPILVMGYVPEDGAETLVEHGLAVSLMSPSCAQAYSAKAEAAGKTLPVHIKVDSGMGRYGLLPEEVLPFCRMARDLPGIGLEGIFTHFCTADAADSSYTEKQFERFIEVIETCKAAGIRFKLRHCCNSAATMRFPRAHLDAVRPGIAMYGMEPSSDWPSAFPLVPALTLKSRIVRVRDLPSGWGVGYGRTFIPNEPIRAGLVPVGYGDGYHRILSNKGVVLVRGGRARILGRVSMDQIIVDVSGIPEAREGDEVVLFGRGGTAELSAEEAALTAGTINYEMTTSLLSRVVRVYR